MDEPELHLHRSIVVRLVSALLAERQDCEMLISTHELNIPVEHPDSQLILVRGCSWETNGAVRNWQVDLLADARSVPEDLRVDLLGSRRKILFVEGTSSSLDQPLYESLFPLVSVRQKESCIEVRRAVVGLRQVEQDHHAEAYGLVDNDAMGDAYKQKLLDEGVFALPMFSVESIYYSEDVLNAVAKRQAETFGIDENVLLSAATSSALARLKQAGKIEHLAARVSERRVRDALLTRIPSGSELLNNPEGEINVVVPSPYPLVLSQARACLDAGDLHDLIRHFPIRETGALGSIAKGLRFNGEADFERAALAAIGGNVDLQNRIKAQLGDLPNKLS